ncbi:MAG: 6-phosphogluconolactonase [Planctomycetota bacterium]
MLTLPGITVATPETETLFEKLGEAFMAAALDAVEQRGVFHAALSGGGTPEPFYVRLVTDPKFRAIPWGETHIWVVDERRVPEDHNKSNMKMLREALTDHIPTPPDQVHPMPVLADDPAATYEAAMEAAFGMKADGDDFPRLDFVLLGMGGDCHTASLFPESPALRVGDRWIVENDGDKVVPPPRLTMTYPLLNAARQLVVLAVGPGKHAALGRVHDLNEAGHVDAANVPISGIEPTQGTLTWYVDHAAVGAE